MGGRTSVSIVLIVDGSPGSGKEHIYCDRAHPFLHPLMIVLPLLLVSGFIYLDKLSVDTASSP